MAQSSAESAHARYEYEAIDADDIRLLRLEDDCTTGRLSFSLQPYARNRAPDYVAISYHWGDEPPLHEITVNGQAMYVRPYIWQALAHITSEHETRKHEWAYFWCDAICIDQANSQEKTEQIRRMDRTFEQARIVIAWLGPDYTAPLHSEGIRYLQSTSDPDWRSFLPWPGTLLGNGNIWSRELLRRPYLYRIWIVQELIASHDVMFLLGRERLTYLNRPTMWALSWHRGSAILAYAFGWHTPTENHLWPVIQKWVFICVLIIGTLVYRYCMSESLPGFQPAAALPYKLLHLLATYLSLLFLIYSMAFFVSEPLLDKLYPDVDYRAYPNLKSWLEFTKHSLCSNPKDRIFALLNIIPFNERAVLDVFFPDYDLSLERIQLITYAFLEQEHSREQSSRKDPYRALLRCAKGPEYVRDRECEKFCELLQIRSPDLADEIKAKARPDVHMSSILKRFEPDDARAARHRKRGPSAMDLIALERQISRQARIDALSIVASKPLSSELHTQQRLLKQKPWYIP